MENFDIKDQHTIKSDYIQDVTDESIESNRQELKEEEEAEKIEEMNRPLESEILFVRRLNRIN